MMPDERTAGDGPRPPLAGWPVLAIAAAHLLLLLAVAGRYGYHRDELYFIEAGEHLAWGYVDQPPFTPLVARAARAVFGDSLVGLRLLPALTTAVTVAVAALVARELGGGRRAQLLAAAAFAGSGFVLGAGHLLATATFDLAAWTVLIWLGARMLRSDDPRWWVPFGLLTGAAVLNKHLVVMLVAALVAGLAADRRRRLLVSPWALAGAALAVAVAAPNLLWQARHGWPQMEMAGAISERIGGENRALLLPGQVVLLGPLLVPLFVAGARRLGWSPAGQAFRPVLWAWGAAVVLALVSGGRPYYPLPLAGAVVVAGAVAAETWTPPSRWRVAAVLVALNAVFVLPIALPLIPAGRLGDFPVAAVNETLAETVGWPELARQVAAQVERLPPGRRADVVILTGSYGEAGALDLHGPDLGLPAPYSGHNSYWHWRRPRDNDAPVLAVRYPVASLRPWFEDCVIVDRVDNGLGVDNEVQGTPIVRCRRVKGSWDDVWPRLRHYT